MFFYSGYMDKHQTTQAAGYFYVAIRPQPGMQLFTSNNERAFVISQLQDILSSRSILEEPDAYRRLASHLDLLAFSILKTGMQFVLFSIAPASVCTFADILTRRLRQYQSEWSATAKHGPGQEHPLISARRLKGPYDALNASTDLHLQHSDWEFDRYSSISFYLHDRRGDWMRLWRLSHLYENEPDNYRRLLTNLQVTQESSGKFSQAIQSLVP